MIRPFTLACAFLAAASGLFLYTKKHETTVLDQRITDIVRETHKIQSQTAMLRTEWALLNQPDRLSALSARFLPALHPMSPDQFVRVSTMEARLPPPGYRPAPPPSVDKKPALVVSANTLHVTGSPTAGLPSHPASGIHPVSLSHTGPTARVPVTKMPAAKAPINTITSSSDTPRSPHPRADRILHAREPSEDISVSTDLNTTPAHVRLASFHGTRHASAIATTWRDTMMPHIPSLTKLADTRPHLRRHLAVSSVDSSPYSSNDALPPPAPLSN